MEKTVLISAILLVSLLDQGLGLSSVKVFYVKPTGPRTECPSGDSPCHSLQYYANHSNFTNNSMFLFLEGEHHLDSIVAIRNVANLSLVGASSGVKILCKSLLSGFHVEEFTGLTMESLAISNCSGYKNTTLFLLTGSKVSLNDVVISGDGTTGLMAIDILGAFSISNSTFLTPHNMTVSYTLCNNRPSYFNFKNNMLATESEGDAMKLKIYCPRVQVVISDSIFEVGLEIYYKVVSNNSLLVQKSIFHGGIMCTVANNLNCGDEVLKFTKVTVYCAVLINLNSRECAVLFEDSTFISFIIDMRLSMPYLNTSVQATFTNVTFVNGSIGKSRDVVYLWGVIVLFENCTFENNVGSAIGALLSKVIFKGSNTFTNNSALNGAGIKLVNGSLMHMREDAHILFEDNHADYVGGAIYTGSEPGSPCFFHVDSQTSNSNVAVNFVGNTADYAGSSMYGYLQNCCGHGYGLSCKQLYDVFNTSNTESDPSAIASDPYEICLCDDGKLKPNCSDANKAYSVHAFPGQAFPVRLAVVGEWFEGVVPAAVSAYFSDSHSATLGPLQTTQNSNVPYCKDFYYSVNTTESMVTFQILPEENFFEHIANGQPNDPLGIPSASLPDITITVHLKACPLGFTLSPTMESCVCDSRIARENVVCDIDNQSFLPPPNSWIGFIEESSSNETGVIFHSNCPMIIGYCLPQNMEVTVNTSDSQCEPHRTGLLCGECEEGYSLNLGDQMCVKCSNAHLLLMLPIAVTGLFLVAALFILNLTVTEGSLNGLIFYANVLGIDNSIPSAGYLYTFLAWINLDLGINVCLFDGMDSYAETWLQFIFPAYLWVIIFVIIQLYNKFPALATRLGGENAVKVLATLLLLSYTKLQRTTATILSFTSLEYPDGVIRYVWLYDPNVDFFKGKHLYLGIAGILVLVVLIIPYTLCLTFFQQLQACSGHRLFQWVNKLKPVFDSYAGPYKDRYRFWTGMLLVVRTLLVFLVTANTAGSADFHMLTILVVSCVLLMANTNGIYKKWPHSYLESFFYLQLGLFAGGVFYASHNRGSIPAVADTSIGLTLVVFLVVVGYNTLCRIKPFMKYCYRRKGYAEIGDDSLDVDIERMTGVVHNSERYST